MDIDLLSKMVKELILDNDRVVLPGLGSFVAEVVPSSFSDKGYTINPPYRRLFFRSNPSEGRELIDFYAQSNKVSADVAERIIRDFISEMRQILHTKKTVIFPGLGRLRATKENNLFFVADEGLDIYPAGFGLEPISLKTHQETHEEVTAAVAGLKSLLTETPLPLPQQEIPEQPEVIQEPDSQSASEPEQETAPVPESVADPVPEADPEPVSEPEPAPESEPEQEPESAPETDPVPDPASETSAEQSQTPSGKTFMKAFIVAASVLLLLTVAYAVVGRMFPEWIDQFLFTPEELEILNRKL